MDPASLPDLPTDCRLVYGTPARRWHEALPLGNGWLGAMVFGGTDVEKVSLNADTFWSGHPRDWDVSGAREAVRRARALLLDGDPLAAEEALRDAQGPFVQSYLPLADLNVTLGHTQVDPGSYRRTLDLDSALLSVDYTVGGVQHRRTAWVSTRLGAVVLEHTTAAIADSALIELTGAYATRTAFEIPEGLALELKAPADIAPPYLNVPHPVVHDGRAGAGMHAIVAVRVFSDGSTTFKQGAVRVENFTRLRVVVTAATGYRGPEVLPDLTPETCLQQCRERLDVVREATLDAALEQHTADHRKTFRRTDLRLGLTPSTRPVTELIATAPADPAAKLRLTELLFQYGRYLLIASSRPGTQPANLQGIWNHDPRPPWSSNYTLNINTQMNYWPSGPANLVELDEPLLRLIDELASTGTRTARDSYGLPGWVAHHNTDLWRQSMAVGAGGFPAVWANWWMGGAWLAHHIWEHYTYTLDVDLLRDHYPALRSCAEFLLAWLAEEPDGSLVTAPSTSPENSYLTPGGRVASVTTGATMDLALTAQVFDDVVSASRVLERDDDFARTVEAARARLRRPAVGSRGQLLEWPAEYLEPDPHHRHVSHLVGIFPGDVHADDPELRAAARVTLDERGDASTGWSRAWKANLWARLGDGDRAARLLEGFCTEVNTDEVAEDGGIYASLLCAHPPFQIDGNFGFTSAVCNMLLASRLGALELLPALPGSWRNGDVRGLVARGNIEVDFAWRESRLTQATLRSGHEQDVEVTYGDETRLVHLHPQRSHDVALR